MSTSALPPDVGGLEPPTSSSQQRRRVAWDKPEPCYCKINETTGLIALSLTPFKTLYEKKPLKEQITILHRLHLQLDAVVTRHKAVKFSGSSESYLIAKCCDSASEAAVEIVLIAEEIMAVNKVDLKGVISFGEVGFALLGSTAWNYQFYGELVTDLKMKAEEFRPGEFKVMPSLEQILVSSSVSDTMAESSPLIMDLRKRKEDRNIYTSDNPVTETVRDEFHTWWATRVHCTDIWFLVVTFIFAAVSIQSQLAQKNSGIDVPLVPLFLQFQCCFANLAAGFVWAVNRQLYIQNHTMIMSCVWCSQFFSRAVYAWTHVPSTLSSQAPSILRLISGMNGPEKLLLMTAPVNLWISGCLHWFGFVGSLGTIYRSCLLPNGTFNASILLSDIAVTVFASLLLLFVLPMAYSIHIERQARRGYQRLCEGHKARED